MSSRRTTSPVARVVLLALALVAGSVAALLAAPDGLEPLVPGQWWIAVLVAVGFAVAERTVFHIEHRREAITVSLSEVPTLFALVFVDLRFAVAARVVGGLASVWFERRPPAYKMLFNAGLFAFETAVAGLAFHLVLHQTGTSHGWLLAAGVVIVGLATAVGSIAVSAAIAQFEGGFLSKASGELAANWSVFALNASISGLVVAPSLIAPWLTPFAVVPLAVFWLFLRRQADVSQELRDTRALHGFSGQISAAADLNRIGDLAVTATVELLRAGRCTLYVNVGGSSVRVAAVGDPIAPPDTQRDLAPGHIDEPRTSPAGRRDVISASLVSDGELIGTILAADREGAADTFSDADADRLATIASQLAAPVARGVLHRQLEHEARHDQLTGLANRSTFERALTRLLDPGSRPPRDDQPITFVAVVDLDRFKEVNDTLGHHAGDDLLVEVAARLRSAVEPSDLLARFSGDEFGIAGTRSDIAAVDRTIRACTTAISRQFQIDGLGIVVNASIGVATASAQHRAIPAASALIRQADIAMYHAKQHHLGHDHYRLDIDRRTPARLSLLADLRQAIDDGEITLHFQPKLDLITNTVCGAEVLARWHHPSRGNVAPADFIAVAEQSGLIRPITDLVLEGTIRAIGELDRVGHHLTLAMNLSTHDLIDELLCDRIEHRLDAAHLPPERLVLEITESTLLYDSPRTLANLNRLNELGVRLSIDDFGTGYSSLSYLRRLPVSELKIDRSFVTNLVIDSQDETIVRSTIDLGHNLGLQVVAEGVETPEVADRLRSLGCDIAQGYGICRPVPLEQLTTWLSTTRYPTTQHSTSTPFPW